VKKARTTYANRGQLGHVLAALMPVNALIVRICMVTGLRISDVLELRTAELKRRQTVRESKTGKTRRIQWPADLYEQMEKGAGKLWRVISVPSIQSRAGFRLVSCPHIQAAGAVAITPFVSFNHRMNE
jgi:integrase